MFDKLEDLVDRLDTLNNQLTDPDIVSDQNKFRKLMKEQSELTPIVEKYKEYKDAKQTIEDSLLMLEEENDEELREMAKEELNEAKATVEKTENELKILLLPKIRTIPRMLSSRSVQVQAEMKPHYLHMRSTECIRNTLISSNGK